jgi:hypothetical protein
MKLKMTKLMTKLMTLGLVFSGLFFSHAHSVLPGADDGKRAQKCYDRYMPIINAYEEQIADLQELNPQTSQIKDLIRTKKQKLKEAKQLTKIVVKKVSCEILFRIIRCINCNLQKKNEG